MGKAGCACSKLGVGGEGGGQVRAVVGNGGGAVRVDLRGADEGVGDGGGHLARRCCCGGGGAWWWELGVGGRSEGEESMVFGKRRPGALDIAGSLGLSSSSSSWHHGDEPVCVRGVCVVSVRPNGKF